MTALRWIIRGGKPYRLNGLTFTCPACGYRTEAQGTEFYFCPICGVRLKDKEDNSGHNKEKELPFYKNRGRIRLPEVRPPGL